MAAGLGLPKVGGKCGGVPTVLMSSSCTCAGSGECPGRGSASQGPSWVWGERGGQRGCKEGRGFPQAEGTSVLGPGTQQPVAGVAYHLERDTGAKFNVL